MSPPRLALLVLATLSPLPAAADLYWRTDGTSGTWTGANWSGTATAAGGAAWVNSANVVFSEASSVIFATTPIGNVTVAAGKTVAITAAGTLATGGNVRTFDVGTGAVLNWAGQDFSTAAGTGFIKNGAGVWNMGANGSSGTYSGGFTLNAGTVIASGVNNFGDQRMTINGGTIESSGSKTFKPSSLVIGGDFKLTGSGNDSWSAATVDLGGGTRVITQDASGDRSFSGQISNGGLTKAGSGVLVLSGANPYTGTTTVSSGILRLASGGSIAGSAEIAIVSGATLDAGAGWSLGSGKKLSGGGTVIGGVTIQGTHAPTGSQAVTGSLAYGVGSVFEWSLGAASVSSGYDKVTVTGSLGAAAGAFRVMTDLAIDGTAADGFWTTPKTWGDIFTVTGTATGWAADTAVAVYSTADVLRGGVGDYGNFSISGKTLTWTPVPEPSGALAGLLLGAGLLRRRRLLGTARGCKKARRLKIEDC